MLILSKKLKEINSNIVSPEYFDMKTTNKINKYLK